MADRADEFRFHLIYLMLSRNVAVDENCARSLIIDDDWRAVDVNDAFVWRFDCVLESIRLVFFLKQAAVK